MGVVPSNLECECTQRTLNSLFVRGRWSCSERGEDRDDEQRMCEAHAFASGKGRECDRSKHLSLLHEARPSLRVSLPRPPRRPPLRRLRHSNYPAKGILKKKVDDTSSNGGA